MARRPERLQKIIARAGIASRRAAEGLITEGRVRVNGRVVRELGSTADSMHDKIEVDGKRIVREKPVYLLLHKPREVVTTVSDPEGRQTVLELMRGVPERIFPVGRLDYHTSGALLLTNDGEFANGLLKPRRSVPKTYVVKVRGKFGIPELDKIRNGVRIGSYTTKPADVFVLREDPRNTVLQVTLTEGKNRQIHRMMEALGKRVQRLSRQSFADVTIEGLRPGEWRPLRKRELEKVRKKYLRAAKD